ncbi:MAG: glycosyltransferase family 4 protein [Candidatus Saccharimonadales bacterium]
MRILMLGWELPPHNAGGMGVVCYQMARALSGRGVSIDFVLPYTAHHPNTEFMNIVSTTQRPPKHGDGLWVYDTFLAGSSEMEKVQSDYLSVAVAHAKKFPPDVIHAHDWLTLRAGIAVKNATNRPLIAHIHATEFDRAGGKNGNPVIHDIEQMGLLMADRIIAISKLQRDLISERYHIPHDKIEIVHNTIDYADFAEPVNGDTYRYAKRLQDEGYCVVSVMNRLTVQKGLTHFMRAAAKASHRLGRFVFIIGGDGEQRDELIEMSADLGIADKVLFTGFVRGKQWRDVFAVSDVFVMSSISEPFGITALEAAAHGAAVVITKQSGAGEVILNGFKYDYWDEDRLADILINLASSASLTAHLQANAKQEIRGKSWQDVATRFIDQYNRVGLVP